MPFGVFVEIIVPCLQGIDLITQHSGGEDSCKTTEFAEIEERTRLEVTWGGENSKGVRVNGLDWTRGEVELP